ncbi:MAG: hypothetical protein IH628_10690 [Proteobacteria bacterium]|nr:hypothetical protein [Pseudomonadota bacterium]
MQAVRPLGRHSFGRYEAIRIFVPAVYGALLFLMFLWTYFANALGAELSTGQSLVLFAFVVLILAMSLYGKEVPKRRRAFSTNQPSFYLSTRARTMREMPLLSDDEARRVYFYILNTFVPDSFHEKIFFFGAVYTILITMRRITLWSAVFGTVVVIAEFLGGSVLTAQHALVLLTSVLWLAYALAVFYNKAERKMQENYQDQIFWLQMNDAVVEEVLRKAKSVSSSVSTK